MLALQDGRPPKQRGCIRKSWNLITLDPRFGGSSTEWWINKRYNLATSSDKVDGRNTTRLFFSSSGIFTQICIDFELSTLDLDPWRISWNPTEINVFHCFPKKIIRSHGGTSGLWRASDILGLVGWLVGWLVDTITSHIPNPPCQWQPSFEEANWSKE